MFTVCPKCALTLVVTAQDLRVAQGYVRCGRCSNVFNAIVGLTDDRGALASSGSSGANQGSSQGTASTSIMRKAPSISDDAPPPDPLSDTGESEAIYAEPDAEDVKFQEVFAEPPAPSKPATPSSTARVGDSEKRYSDTEGIETYPDSELEFNPELTDVSKVFVEAAPVTFKGNGTGQFRKIVLRPEERAPAVPPARSSQPAPPPPSPPAPKPQNGARAAAPSPTPAAKPATQPSAPKQAAPARPPSRDAEDLRIDDELRSLAARIDVTSSRPALKIPAAPAPPAARAAPAAPAASAANDEAIQEDADRDAGTFDRAPARATAVIEFDSDIEQEESEGAGGDIYARAKPRPPPPRNKPKGTDTAANRGRSQAGGPTPGNDDEIQAEGADMLAPAQAPRGRFMLWVAGAAVLSVALVAQAVHHNRHELATRALLNRPLTRFYKAINVPLVPSWDLTAYDVRQLGASTNEGQQGTLTVRASLKNTAAQPLPLPLLRITMQDRYGNRIATRDVAPTGYVPGTVPADAQLGAGQRIDAEMSFKDPGQDAVGFEIDACLITASGRINCANDIAAAAR